MNCFSRSLSIVTIAAAVVLAAGTSFGSNVSLAWDRSSEQDIAGYRLHIGTASGVYTHHLDAGNNTSTTVTSLPPGDTFFFTVTAYNSNNAESGYSNEVSYSVPNSRTDFNYDGNPDYVLYNASTRRSGIWYFNNNLYLGSTFGPSITPGWNIAGVSDFNHDGNPDYVTGKFV